MARKRVKPEDDSIPLVEEEDVQDSKAVLPEHEGINESVVAEVEFEPDEVQAELQDVLSPDEQLAVFQLSLDEVQAKADEYLDGWQRSRAEFANYKKRIEREREEERSRIKGEILIRYIGIVDDLERALKDRPQQEELASWAEGIDLIYRKLKTILESEGITRIEAEGKQFDPNYHEAITQVESDDHQEGEIVEVIQQGYQIGERVLRPALVRVAK